MLTCRIVAALAAGLVYSTTCSAQTVYEGITGRTLNAVFLSDPTSEHAQALTLASVAPVSISSVQMLLRNISTTTAYQGQLTVSLYVGAGALPSALIATQQVNVSVPFGSDLLVTVPFNAVQASTNSIWLGYNIPANALGGPTIVGLRESQLPPNLSIGTATGWNTRRALGEPAWQATQPPIFGGSAAAVRVIAIPAPASGAALALAGVVASRRRRA